MKIDLHSHTTISDGSLTPQELVERATNKCVDMLAITDHDTIDGLQIAHDYIAAKNYSLKLIDGVEISTHWRGFEIHVVGLNVDRNCTEFKKRLSSQSEARRTRASKIGEKLKKYQLEEVYHRATLYAGDSQICRSHFARALVEMGYVGNFEEAFKKYLGKKARCYVAPQWVEMEDGISWIHQAGGVAVLAHPQHYDLSNKWLRYLFADFKQANGDAMEVSQSQLSPGLKDQMANYALDYGLLASAGSDFHKPLQWLELGKNLKVPEKVEPIWNRF